jgi:cell division protein FtsA
MSAPKHYAVGLDVGSSRTRCLVCLLDDSRLRYLGHADVPSAGWSKGRISDQGAATESIRVAVTEAERCAQVSVEGAVVGVGGASIEGMNGRGLYEFGRPREIDPGDLNYAVELASKIRLQEDRIILQVAPQDFTLDGRAGYRKPKGVVCARLEANVHVISTSVHEHQALVNAVHHAHLAVEETIFEPVAAGYASVLADERSRGVAVVDIGAHSTDMVIYDGDALLRASSIPISADHFTRDVAIGLNVTYEDAEQLKRDYGCAVLGLTSEHSLIELPSGDGRPPREAPRTYLNDILEARAQELFQHVRAEIAKVGMEQALLEGFVLTGGGALLPGMCDVAETVMNCQARNGLPVGIAGLPDEINDPAWCVAAGLSMYSAKLKTRKEWKRTVPGILGLLYDKGVTGGQHGGN